MLWVLVILLIGLSFSFFLEQDLKSPAKLESWVSNSGLYQLVINNLTEQVMVSYKPLGLSNSNNQALSKIITSSLRQTISKTYFNQTVNQIILTNFNWLDGKISQPNFSINLSRIQSTFVQNLSNNLQVSSICVPVRSVPGAGCLPVGEYFNISINQISSNFILLNQSSINQNNVGSFLGSSSSTSLPYYQRYSYLPSDYKIMLKMPYILIGLIAAVLGLSLIMLGISLRFIKLIFKSVLIAALILLLLSFLNNTILKWIEGLSVVHNNQAAAVIGSIINSAFKDISSTNIKFIKIYVAAVGLMILLWLFRHLLPKKKNKKDSHNKTEKNSDSSLKNSDRNILM